MNFQADFDHVHTARIIARRETCQSAFRLCAIYILRDKKIGVFSQGTDDSKNLRCETLYNDDYEHVNISSFAVLDIKLWLKEDGDFNPNRPLYLFKFIQSKAQN